MNKQEHCLCGLVKDWCAICREYENEEAEIKAMKTLKMLNPKAPRHRYYTLSEKQSVIENKID